MSRELLLPELMEPGRKPIGPAEIDWNHKLSKELIEWAIFHHDFETLDGSSNITIEEKGICEHFDGINDLRYMKDVYYNPIISAYVLCKSDTASVIAPWTGPLHRETDFNVAWDTGLESHPRGAVYYKTAEAIWARIDISPLNANTWYGIGVTRLQSGITVYKDGEFLDSNFSGQSDTTQQKTSLAVHAAAPDQKWDGYISIAAIWNRALSAEEHRSFHSNPYQILKPAGL